MAVELATAYVALTVEAKNVGREITQAMDKTAPAADRAGKNAGKRFAGGMTPALKGMITGIGGALAAIGIKDLIGDALGEARESQKVGALTASIIKSTGGAAKVTADQVGALAESISNKTGKDDELIQTGANLLLTFKNVRNEAGKNNDVFNQATQAAVDLSAAGFGSVDGAAKMLGKALNDPVKGISALGRAGVTFTDQQKEQIKTLVKSGDVLGAQKIILGEVKSQVGGAAEATATWGDKARVTFDNMKESLGTALLPYVDKAGKAFVGLVDGWRSGEGTGGRLRDIVTGVGSALAGTTRFLIEHKNWVAAAAGAMAALFAVTKLHAAFLAVQGAGGLAKYIAQTKIVTAMSKAWAAVQWLVNAALSANPIGIAVVAIAALVAAVVIAYKKSDTFRAIVQAAWKGIQSVISAVVGWFTKTAWPALKGAFDAIARVATWLWQNIIGPHFRNMQRLIGAVAGFIVGTVWPKIRSAFDFIAGKARWLWNTILKPIFDVWKKVIGAVATFIATTVWPKISSAFGWIGSKVKSTWDKVIRPAFDLMKSGVSKVQTAFEKTKDGIGRAWDKLKGLAKAPIKFIINTVINDGLIGGYNWLVGKIGGEKLGRIPLPRGFKSGGVLPGYSPGRDIHRFISPTGGILDLSGGEAVMRPEFTRLVGGSRGVAELNKAAIRGQLPFQAHAGGGVIGWIKSKAMSAWDWVKDKSSALFKAFSNPVKWLRERLPRIPGSDMLSELASGVVSKGASALAGKAKSLWNTFKGALGKVQEEQGTGEGRNARGWQQLWSIVKRLVPSIQLTSAFRPGAITASGNRSMHSMGRAIDVAPPNMAAFNKIRGAFPNATELIYSPAGMRQLKNGRPYVYGEPVRSMHYDHIHLAMRKGGTIPVFDQGGTLKPGINVVDNRTGGPEVLRPVGRNDGDVTVYMTVSVDDLEKMTKVGDFLEMLDNARMNGRKTARSGRTAD